MSAILFWLRYGKHSEGNDSARLCTYVAAHDYVTNIPWRRYWPFEWGIHWSSVNSPHKGQAREAMMFSLIYAPKKGWVNNRDDGVTWDAITLIMTSL